MRSRGGMALTKSKNRVFKEAKGFWGGRGRLWKTVMQVVRRSHQEAFKGRRLRKRDMRYLWITRVNAAVRARGMTYSVFMGKLAKSGLQLNRKTLSEVAARDPKGFDAIFAQVTKG